MKNIVEKQENKDLWFFRYSMPYILLSIIIFFVISSPVLAQEITQQVDGFTLEGFDKEGERAWDVTGSTADILGETIKISDVDANAYGEQDFNLKANYGEVDKKSGNVHLQEDVVVTSQNGDQLKTDSLNWEKGNNIVSTADPAEISNESINAKGVGLTANPGLKTAQLERDVVVEAQSQGEEGSNQQIVITCDGPMEVDQRANVAILRENVVAIRGDQTLKADLVEIHFDPVTKKIVTIICTDNVSVQRGDNISYSEKAVYSAADQKVIFVGRPKLIMTSSEEMNTIF